MSGSTDLQDLYKVITLLSHLPRTFNRQKGSSFAKLLTAVGESDNNIGGLFGKANFYGETELPASGQDRSAIDQARDSMFLNTSSGKHLTELGGNYGVPRPPQSPYDDELYRKVIAVLAWLPKTPALVAHKLAEAVLGDQETLINDYGHAWQIYEVNPNEIIIECPADVVAGSTSTASYMHGEIGTTTQVIGPTGVFQSLHERDPRLAVSGGNFAGLTIYLFHTGVWNAYTITTCNVTSGLATWNVLPATIPSGFGYKFFVDIPGTSSFNPGDFMEDNALVEAGGLNPPSDSLVYLYSKGVLDIFEFYMNNFVRASGVTLRTEIL